METLITETTEYFALPSLEYQVLLRIVTDLWNRETARNGLRLSFHSSRDEHFHGVLSVIRDNINRMPLPSTFKKELLRFNEGISGEILKWSKYHNENYCLNIVVPKTVCWKPSGTINYEKTAKLLTQNSTLTIFTRLFLSFMYGFEDSTKELLTVATENDSNQIKNTDAYFLSFWAEFLALDTNSLWNDIRGNQEVENILIQVFRMSVKRREIFVSEYIIKKLKPENKRNLVTIFEETTAIFYAFFPRVPFITNFVHADILCWLLHKLEKQQQQRMLMKHPFPVLISYLEWPRQGLFLKMANYLFKYLSGIHFGYLLKEIAYRKTHDSDFDYGTLFGQFWRHSHAAHKKYAIATKTCWSALYHLFMIGDIQNIEMCFENATDDQKQKFLNSNWGTRMKIDLHHMGKNDLLNHLENCLPLK
ncbi:uncharacterized protein NPIL_540111 [Nephila pilipes]|uniref:Uncharacterized protein n=1 Tax=Nephila pilipes TaxID=299642 RepID=A0A8X6N469_NEPPI|nr:uncharacterized protein NPIL_540111 [Nephila pilipes]